MTNNIQSVSKTESRKEKLLETQRREEENERIVKEYIQQHLAMKLAKRNHFNDENHSDQVL